MRSASPEDVKKAYRELAKAVHPDRSEDPEAQARFQQIVDAYQVLSDQKQRQAWDAANPVQAAKSAATDAAKKIAPGVMEKATEVVGGVMESIHRRWSLGQDLRYTVDVSFSEACLGVDKDVAFEAPVRCQACDGRGHRDGQRCGACQGEGVVLAQRRFRITIPPGTTAGRLTRIPRGGTPGAKGGPEGDLTFIVAVAPHPLLERDGHDVSCQVVVPITTALAGGTVPVPTLEGSTSIEIPAGVEAGQVLRLTGRGVPRPKGGRGDLRITVDVELPARISPAVRRLLEEAERADPEGMFPRSTRYRARWGETND